MAFWSETVGGGLINSSSTSYKEYQIVGSITLDWPMEAAGPNVVADSMAFSFVGPATVVMPDAKRGSTGVVCEIFNDGLGTLTIKTATGAVITDMEPSQTIRFVLRDNSTVGGSWRAIGLGGSASVAHASALQSETVVAEGNTLVQALPVFNLASNYTIARTERGKLINWQGGSGVLTLDDAATLGEGWFMHVRHSGDGVLDLTATGSNTIDGGASISFAVGQSAIVVCNGSNFFSISRVSSVPSEGGGGGEGGTFTLQQINLAGSGDFVVPPEQLGASAYRFYGLLTANRTVIVPTSLAAYWVRNETTGPYTLTVKTAAGTGVIVNQNASKILYSNGTNVVDAATPGISVPLGVTEGGTGAITASAARSNLGASSVGNAIFTAATAAAAKAALVLVKADVGLGNVDNTPDASKPVSNAMQTALNGKAAINGNANQPFTVSSLTINGVGDLVTLLSAKAHLNGSNTQNFGVANLFHAGRGIWLDAWMDSKAALNGNSGVLFYAANFNIAGWGWITDLLTARPANGANASFANLTLTSGLNIEPTQNGSRISRSDGPAMYFARRGNDPDGAVVYFERLTTIYGSISFGSGTTRFNTTSDGRLKPQREDFDPRSWLADTKVVRHNWLDHRNAWSYGVIAQDEYQRFPQAISVGNDKQPGEEGFEPWSADYSKYVAPLLRAWQLDRAELMARIEALEAKLA